MKKIIAMMLIILVSFSCMCIVVFSSPNPYQGRIYNVDFLTIDELIEFLETEDEENFAIWKNIYNPNSIPCPGFLHTISQYREHGEVLECDYAQETGIVEGRKCIWNDNHEKEKAGILEYRFSRNDEHIEIKINLLKEDELSIIQKSGLQTYLETVLNVTASCKGEMNTTIASGEKVSFLNYGRFLAFVYEGNLIRIFQNSVDQIKFSFLNQLQLKEHAIEGKTSQPGYGDLLVTRDTLNSYRIGQLPEEGSLEEVRQYAKEYIQTHYNRFNKYTVELFSESYVPAVEGTIDDPEGGVEGSYSYQVKLTDQYGRSVISDLLTESIPTGYFGLEDFKVEDNQVSIKYGRDFKGMYNRYFHPFFAFYKDNMFLSRQTIWRSGTFSAQIPEEANKIKVFLWESENFIYTDEYKQFTTPILPAKEAQELTKNEQGEWE